MGTGVGCPPTWAERVADCRWTYLIYAFGTNYEWISGYTDAEKEFGRRHDFFSQSLIDPLNYANLSVFPPVFIVAGKRDYYFSDSPHLAYNLCMAGVGVETMNVEGLFHDWWMYSNGCGVNGTLG